MPQSDNEYFTYYNYFNVSPQNLDDYTKQDFRGIVDTIIGYCSEGDFEVKSRAIYKALEHMIKERGCDEEGVYTQEAKDALENLYQKYYAKFSDVGEQKIELKDRPKGAFQRFQLSIERTKDSFKAFGKKLFLPFSGIKNIFKNLKSAKIPQRKVKNFSLKKPSGLKYYLGAAATSVVLFFGLKGDAFSSFKKAQNEAKENKTEVKNVVSEASENIQKEPTLSVEEVKRILQKTQETKKKTVQKTDIEPDPKPVHQAKKDVVKKITENKTNYQKSQRVSQGKTQGSKTLEPSFHESRLYKFLGQQKAQELCHKVKSKCPQMTTEEVNFVAYGYVMNEKYVLGTDNPICQALASARPLTKAEQATLSQYVKEKIGSRGQFAQKRAQEITAKRLEQKAKASQTSQESREEINEILTQNVSQDSVSQSQSSFVSSDSISVSTQSVQVTTVSPVKKMTRAEKRAQKKAEAKAKKREKKIQRAKEKEAKKRALEKKVAKETALRHAREQGKNFSLAQLRHVKENIRNT